MTKDETRALLAQLVPAAIKAGNLFVHPIAGSGKAPGKVRGKPNTKAVPEYRTPRPRHIHQRQGVKGAGFEIETYKNFQGVGKDDLAPTYKPDATVYFCHACDQSGKDCTC